MLRSTFLAQFVTLSLAAYVIQKDYEPSTFADQFDFFTDTDPTEGYVNYVDQSTARQGGFYRVDGDQVFIGVDTTNVASGRGRDSVRISSKESYNHGLFVLDLAHMPGGQCGTWPAFWLLGPNWPHGGEVDIIEGVNTQQTNKMTLHTSSGCTVTNRGQFSGLSAFDNCDINAPDQPYNTGCGIGTTRDDSYGVGFNAVGGGVYATEWTSERFAIWFFPRAAIPADIKSGQPDPENWGLPMSEFSGDCDLDSKFRDQQMIFDITFCGVWAGYDWTLDATCSTKASSCDSFVKNNPSAFIDTYWLINSLKVYQDNGAPVPSTTASTTTTTTTTTSETTSTTTSSFAVNTSVATSTSLASTTSLTSTDTTISTTTSFSPSNTSLPLISQTTDSSTTSGQVNATTATDISSSLPTSSSLTTEVDITVTVTITLPITAQSAPPSDALPTDAAPLVTLTTIITTCTPAVSGRSCGERAAPTIDPVPTVSPESTEGGRDDGDGGWHVWDSVWPSWRASRQI